MKLNLGCGKVHMEGYVNVDHHEYPGVDLVCDLREDWPWEDESVEAITASHIIEHLPDFQHFMNEAHRVLAPGCPMHIATPSPLCEWYWQDPTHIRGYMPNTFRIYCVDYPVKHEYGIEQWSSARVDELHETINGVQAITFNVYMVK